MNFEPSLHKLPNGLTVILDPMDAATTKVIVAFDTGSREESPEEYGITHFCEHMLCKGTQRFKDYKAIDNYIGDNYGSWNAFTSDYRLQLLGRICYENTDVLIDVFADLIQNSAFNPDVVDRERGIILDELRRSQDNMNEKFSGFMNQTLLGGKYPEFRTLGTEESIKSFTPQQLKSWLDKRLSAKNCVICVSGRIDSPDKLLKKIEMKYAFMPSKDVHKKVERVPYTPNTGHFYVPDTKNTTLVLLKPELWKYRKENKYKRMCLIRFDSCLRQRLFDTLRQSKGLVYGLKSIGFGPDEQRLTGFQTTSVPSNLEEITATMAQIIRKVCTEMPPTQEYIKLYNNRCKLGDADFLESNESRSNKLVHYYLDFGELYDFNSVLKKSAEMTAEDVIKYSRGYLDKPFSILTYGAKHDVDLMKVWNENIGSIGNTTAKILVKDDKCR